MLVLDWNIIWTIVNIIVLFLFLKRFLFGPVTAMMDKRGQLIEDSFQEAKKKQEEAKKLKTEYEIQLSQADVEAEKIIKAARNQADIEYSEKINEIEEETGRMMETAKQSIAVEKEKSMQEAQKEVAAMAILMASKMLGNSVNESVNKRMVSDFVKEVGAAK